MTTETVGGLLFRVRSGDPTAAEELVRIYEPELRRAIRVRLTDTRLRRLVDSIDICQSVLAGFFVRTAAGQYDLQTPQELLSLLVTMARNRVIDCVRHSQAHRPVGFRDVSLAEQNGNQIPSSQPGPASVLVNRDLLEQVRNRLTSAEVRLMEQRAEGLNWNEIAAATDESPNTVRMRLTRALDRVAEELGLETSHV